MINHLIQILRIEWRQATRSSIWHRSLAINAFLALTFLYLIGNFFVLGILLDDILIKLPIDDIDYNTYGRSFVLRRLNQYLLYYFLVDFVLRYMMQKLPALAVQPYLHLPISKTTLANFMLAKSKWSPFNLSHFVILGPFMVEVYQNLPSAQALGWIFGISTLVFASNFLLLLVKRSSESDARVYVGLLLTLAAIASLHYFDLIEFTAVSSFLFNALFLHPLTALVPAGAMFLFYYFNLRYLKSNMYLSKLSSSKADEITYVGGGVLSRFGLVGKLVELDLKFIWRNKRSRSVLLMSAFFLLYGLLVFTQPDFKENYLMYIVFSLIITGMFMLNFGQYLLGWDASHFDHVLTRNVSFYNYYMSKFLLFAVVSSVSMVLSIPYAYFGWEVLLALFCVFLFNVGINSHFVMFFGSYNPKKIDLSKTSMMNWQGVGAAQFLIILPVMGLPMVLYFLGAFIWSPIYGVVFLGVLGLLGIAATRFGIQALATWLWRQRYGISSDFRNQ